MNTINENKETNNKALTVLIKNPENAEKGL